MSCNFFQEALTVIKPLTPEEITARAAGIKLLVLDVDGVMTDGQLYFTSQGDEIKGFSTLDGQGIKLLRQAGIEVAIISGRDSPLLARRAGNLGITLLFQGREDKLVVLDEILTTLGLKYHQTAYVGDDLPDIGCMLRAGLSISVPNAHAEAMARAHYLTTLRGGHGAVREVCDLILRAQLRYDAMMQPYLGSG
jgi:3-deoxy-D-manno-octulosonate 8-phosphate phosphatase (KDO 8-P phosphatase)